MSAQIIPFQAMADLPNRIRELRSARRWSQDILALAVGCSKPQISDLERGKKPLTVEWMRRIAVALDVPPADLLSREDNPLLLSEAERELIARLRSASPEQRQNVERVTEALIPYRGPDRQDAA
ncbi:MAG: helix-turn-helix domain-containing protein [Pseudomonadota bacterium]|nr:helix-turn-helix domain-containing protein [Pseudomonadota bacterium]